MSSDAESLMHRRILVFSDLDGCLLNKHDYSYADAETALARLRAEGIPLILASSKTEAEMRPLAAELATNAPIVCENGGIVYWNPEDDSDEVRTVTGTSRDTIAEVLSSLRQSFHFETFADMGVDGIMSATDLPREKAERASRRACTEPLLWLDVADKATAFRSALEAAGLTLTQGGRFWHVAGRVSKATGMKTVETQFRKTSGQAATIALGDSPIDAAMLEAAQFPIVIPQMDGTTLELANPAVRIAEAPGAAGWNSAMHRILDELCG